MDATLKLIVLLTAALNCNGVSIREQIAHIARRFNMPEDSVILGAPSYPSHLPEAEAILPGHTLLRPAMGMLKSAIKFPHRERENGAGVYGNTNNLGIRYDGRNERLMYSGFRRTPTEVHMYIPESSELNSLDSSSEELSREEATELRQAKNQPYKTPQRNTDQQLIKKSKKTRLLKIYPAKPRNINPKPYDSYEMQNLLFVPKDKRLLYKEKNKNHRQKLSGQEASESELCWSNKGLHGQPNTKCTQLDTRLHTTDEIAGYVEQMLHRIHSERRQTENIQKDQVEPEIIKIITENLESSGSNSGPGGIGDNEFVNPEYTTKEKDKKNAFWKTKDSFDHIKFSPDAPELDEYLPLDTTDNDEKNWWFYHQADFRPFNENDV